MAATEPQRVEVDFSSVPFTGAILQCPVDAYVMDADGWGKRWYECPNCGTEFCVILDPRKVAEFALHG